MRLRLAFASAAQDRMQQQQQTLEEKYEKKMLIWKRELLARFQQQKDQLTAASETGAEHQAELASNALSAQLLEQEIARSQLSSLQAELARLRGEKEQIQREAERQR